MENKLEDLEQQDKYISIYKLAKMIGKDPEKIRSSSDRTRFANFINNLPDIKIKKLSASNKEENYPPDSNMYLLEDVRRFLNTHITRKDAIDLIGVSIPTFDKNIKKYKVPMYQVGNVHQLRFYPLENIKEIYNEMHLNFEQYISGYKLAQERFMRTGPSFIWRMKENIDNFPNPIIKPVKLAKVYHDEDRKRYIDVVYSKNEVESFFAEYISKKEIITELSKIIDKTTVYKHYNLFNVTEYKFGSQPETIFIHKNDYMKIAESVKSSLEHRDKRNQGILYIDGECFYTNSKVMQMFNIGSRTAKKIREEEILHSYGKYKLEEYFKEIDVIELYNKSRSELESLQEGFYSIGEIREKYGKYYANQITKPSNVEYVVRRTLLPLYLKGYYKANANILFNREDIDRYSEKYNISNQLNNISINDSYEEFIYKVEKILKAEFSENQKLTKQMWYEYVRKFLNRTRRLNKNDFIHTIVNTTDFIVKIFDKEIYSYSSDKINKEFLNENSVVPRNCQREFYRFLRKVHQAFISQGNYEPFNFKDLNNPTDYKRIIEVDFSIYSLEEYHKLYEYVNKLEIHKQKALMDVNNYIQTRDFYKYNKYDSYWVYVLVHLTNNWRHSTIMTQIPRIDLLTTNVKSLEWLAENNLTIDDANDIIFQIGRYITKINKTNVKAEGIFQIGEPLKIAFATAVSICELRTRIIDENSSVIIKFSNKNKKANLTSRGKIHKKFFEEYELKNEFEFENRKMNRTLTTLIYSVLRHLGKGLKEAQISRYHLDEQTTIDHYIKLSEEQVNRLVNELFERNNFGYITQLMSNLLFGININKTIETERMIVLNNLFGDSIKIEATAGLINKLANDKFEVEKYLKSCSFDKLQQLYKNMIVGNLQSKQKYYQCIFYECKFEENHSCESCAASIINVYALSQIMDNYIYSIYEILNSFDSAPLGEKRKMANHFHMMHQVVQEARNKFGRNIVDSFIEGGTEKIKDLGKLVNLKNIKKYKSI